MEPIGPQIPTDEDQVFCPGLKVTGFLFKNKKCQVFSTNAVNDGECKVLLVSNLCNNLYIILIKSDGNK